MSGRDGEKPDAGGLRERLDLRSMGWVGGGVNEEPMLLASGRLGTSEGAGTVRRFSGAWFPLAAVPFGAATLGLKGSAKGSAEFSRVD